MISRSLSYKSGWTITFAIPVSSSRLRNTKPLAVRSEEHTSELQSRLHLVCRLLLEKKKRHTTLTLPAGGSTQIVAANAWGPEAQFRFQSYTMPTTLYADAGDGMPAAIKSLPACCDSSGLMTEQFFATSRDGTQIPYFVTRSKTLAGPAPTVLYGYGGFEVSETPSYSPNFGMLWLSRGGGFVVANIRGGGGNGPAWDPAAPPP